MQVVKRVQGSIFLRVLSIAVLTAAPTWLAGAGTGASSQLLLRVQEGAALEMRGPDVIVQVRLDRGVTARIWSATDCSLPAPHATVISTSGTHTFPVASLATADNVVVCLATSDQHLHVQASLR